MRYLASVAMVVASLSAFPRVGHADVVVVGSTQLPISQISVTNLRDLYTGRTRQLGALPVTVIDRNDDSPDRGQFISKTLGFSPEEFHTVQRVVEYIGKPDNPPKVARTRLQMLEMVANSSNALGYVSKKEFAELSRQWRIKEIRITPE
ncbi:hypothetical protein NQT62_04175 [Limnobacter humi]|uniref:Phosphate ABC transporter substrate-binding protein n=1 Tax=Limnobacter humi TaxID=1778671 RepID=A0ABT1WDN7_9BURK|nr:hypothetical protein [Limnobacter humi]MCQ8895639.1 hypothetical protein [Limnobacter humi]